MKKHLAPQSNHAPVCPLPYALYESNGSMLELYQGGRRVACHSIDATTRARLPVLTGAQPRRTFHIVWEVIGQQSIDDTTEDQRSIGHLEETT